MSENFPNSLIDEEKFDRFDQRDNVFGRVIHDETAPFFQQGMYDHIEKVVDTQEGYGSFELARAIGGWSVYDYFTEAFEPKRSDRDSNIMDKPTLKPPTKDPEVLTREIKKAARAYGASLVGVTEVDSRWVYRLDREGNSVDNLLDYDYAVVMIVPMDPISIKESPAFTAARASAVSYSRMAFLVSCLSEFIRRLGYRAAPMGNGGALSIPLAMDAGLGQLGRNGLLVNPKFGSCIKICKIFTDMELVEDDSVDPPLLEQCYRCELCSKACEVDAISERVEPETGRVCPSNNEGVFRWPVNHYRCYQFWLENGSDCSSCVAACPYTPDHNPPEVPTTHSP